MMETQNQNLQTESALVCDKEIGLRLTDGMVLANCSFFDAGVSCGFPSPADEYLEAKLDLNQHLIAKPNATFFVRANGDSMIGAGIYSGDILIIDRSLCPSNGKIVLAVLNSEFTLKRYLKKNHALFLVSENAKYPMIEVKPEMDFQVWGVATYCIHKL